MMYPYQRLIEGRDTRSTSPHRRPRNCSLSSTTLSTIRHLHRETWLYVAGRRGVRAMLTRHNMSRLWRSRRRALPEYIRNDPDVQRIVRHFMEGDLPVAQLCHAPLVLAAAGTLQGRRTAAYPALEADVKAAGAECVDGAGVVDGQMVSARAWPDNPAWMREFIADAPGEGPSHRMRGRRRGYGRLTRGVTTVNWARASSWCSRG